MLAMSPSPASRDPDIGHGLSVHLHNEVPIVLLRVRYAGTSCGSRALAELQTRSLCYGRGGATVNLSATVFSLPIAAEHTPVESGCLSKERAVEAVAVATYREP